MRSRAPLRAPLKAGIWLTDACNLACKYCYAAPFSGRVMDQARALRLIDELRELRVFEINLAGGEPLLHPQFDAILQKCATTEIWCSILTNGTLLNEERLARYAPLLCDRRRFLLQVSLDSPDPLRNDRTRGEGALVARNIHRAAAAGIPLQIACVLTTANIETAPALIDAYYPGVKSFHFMSVQPTAESIRHPQLFPTAAEIHAFWLRIAGYAERLADLRLPSMKTYFATQAAANGRGPKAAFNPTYCAVAYTQAEIRTNLDVYGCDIAKEYSYIGSLRDASFAAVWHSERAAMVRSVKAPLCGLRECAKSA